MWCRFLEGFNGKVYFLEEEWHSDQTLNLFTDSSGSVELGCGAYFNREWCFFGWPKHWKYIDGLLGVDSSSFICHHLGGQIS